MFCTCWKEKEQKVAKFEEFLSRNIIKEWKEYYISYSMLIEEITLSKNKLLSDSETCTKSGDEEQIEMIDVHSTSTKEPLLDYCLQTKIIAHFETILNAEIHKMNSFYVSIAEESQTESQLIKKRLDNKQNPDEIYLRKIKKDIFVLYQQLVSIINFATLKRMATDIVCDEFNKELQCDTTDIPEVDVIQSTKCTQFMDDLIKIYANVYENGDLYAGKTHLFQTISRTEAKNQWKHRDKALFWMGTKCGIMLALIVFAILIIISHSDGIEIFNVLYIYRCLSVLLILLWLWSINVYIWSNKRINYSFVFELNPSNRLTFLQCFDSAITLSILYFSNVILFIESYHHLSAKWSTIWPSSLFVFYIIRLIVPLFRHWSTRKFLLNSILQCVIAPFGRVQFRDFFIGDVLTSLSKVFTDIYLSGCMIVLTDYSGSKCTDSRATAIMTPILICSPYWYRFMQCLNRYYITGERRNNGANAFKYGLSISVTLMGALHSSYSQPYYTYSSSFDSGRVIWLILTLISTLYLIFWDTNMDWNLFPCKERIKSYPKYWYLAAVIIDILLRFTWSFTLFPTHANPYFYIDESWEPIVVHVFFWIIYVAEVFRRSVWSIFRVEKAHNGQKEEFKTFKCTLLFCENNTLIKEKQKKARPLTMCKEVITMCLVLIVIAAIIITNR